MKLAEETFEQFLDYFDSQLYFHRKHLAQWEVEEARYIERTLYSCIAPAVGFSGSIYCGEIPDSLPYKMRRYLIAQADKDESPGSREAGRLLDLLEKAESINSIHSIHL